MGGEGGLFGVVAAKRSSAALVSFSCTVLVFLPLGCFSLSVCFIIAVAVYFIQAQIWYGW